MEIRNPGRTRSCVLFLRRSDCCRQSSFTRDEHGSIYRLQLGSLFVRARSRMRVNKEFRSRAAANLTMSTTLIHCGSLLESHFANTPEICVARSLCRCSELTLNSTWKTSLHHQDKEQITPPSGTNKHHQTLDTAGLSCTLPWPCGLLLSSEHLYH
jgi:hypothetical protein